MFAPFRSTVLLASLSLVAPLGCARSDGLDLEGASLAAPLAGELLISEVQTRGTNGGDDEFVELYNPGDAPLTLDGTWTVSARSAVGACGSNAEVKRFAPVGTIPAHGHLLATGKHYDGPVPGDVTYATGIPDAASVVLRHGTEVVDSVCFAYDAATRAALTGCAAPYTCNGEPASNAPHDNTTHAGSNSDVGLERGPGGDAGNAEDTNDDANDFAGGRPSTPQNLASAPTPPVPSSPPPDACPVPTAAFSVMSWRPFSQFDTPAHARLQLGYLEPVRVLAAINFDWNNAYRPTIIALAPAHGVLTGANGGGSSSEPSLQASAYAVADGPDGCVANNETETDSNGAHPFVGIGCLSFGFFKDVAENARYTSIAIADLGATKVVLGTDAEGLHAVDVGANGALAAVLVDGAMSNKVAAIVGAAGDVHVLYEVHDSSYVSVRHARRHAGAWSVTTVDGWPGTPSPTTTRSVALARTPEGAPVALFELGHRLRLAEWTGAAFAAPVTLDWTRSGPAEGGADVAIGVDCAGRRRVAYTRYLLTDDGPGVPRSHIRLGVVDSSGTLVAAWAPYKFAPIGGDGFAYAVDPAGHDHLAVAEGRPSGDVFYATR